MIRRRAFLAVLAAACAFEGCSGGRPAAGGGHQRPVIGVSLLNLSNEFIVMLNQAMQAKAKALGVGPDRQRRAAERRPAGAAGGVVRRAEGGRHHSQPVRGGGQLARGGQGPGGRHPGGQRKLRDPLCAYGVRRLARRGIRPHRHGIHRAAPGREGQRPDDARIHGAGRADQARPGRARGAGAQPRPQTRWRSRPPSGTAPRPCR